MARKSLLLALCLSAGILTGCEHMNMGQAFQAGLSVFKAATLSDSEMTALGLRSAQQLDSENKVASTKSSYSKRLKRLTRNLHSYEGRTLNFKVYQKNEVNAFALPNGDIRVYTALMDMMTDDELLFVIGHEIGHVVKQHSKSKARTDLLTTALRQAGAASTNAAIANLSAGQVGEIAHKLVGVQYSQSAEYEADAFGLKVLKEQGRPKAAAVSALRKLASLGSAGSIFASHPEPGKRADRIAKMD